MNIASLFQGAAAFAWLLVIGVFVALVVAASRNRPVRRGAVLILASIVFALLMTTVSASAVFIQPQERGVVISAISPTGYREKALEPGSALDHPICRNRGTLPNSEADLHHVDCAGRRTTAR
jgi:hypothetical protein